MRERGGVPEPFLPGVRGWTEGFYIKPRIDLELLRQHSGGLIALSACLAGEIPRRLRNGEYDNAKDYALELAEIFGPDHFYLELQDHGIRDQQIVNQGILRIHQETGIPMVCTNDCPLPPQGGRRGPRRAAVHPDRQDHRRREPDALRAPELLPPQRRRRWRPCSRAYEGALENTAKIAELCNLEFTFGKYHLPEFQLPEGYDSFSYLKKLCDEGYRERYGDRRPSTGTSSTTSRT